MITTSAHTIPPTPSYESSALMKRLVRHYVAPYRTILFYAIGCMVTAAAATALMAWVMQPVLDEIFVKQKQELLVPIAAAVIVISFIKGLATYGESVFMQSVAQRVGRDLQVDLYKHLLKADISFFANTASGTLLSRFTNDNFIIRRNIVQTMIGGVKEPITLLFLVGVMFYQNFELAILAFIIFPAAIYPIVWLGKKMRTLSRQTQETVGKLSAAIEDTFQGIRIVKAYNSEDHEAAHVESIVNKTQKYFMKGARISAANGPIMETLAGIAIASVIAYGGAEVLKGTTTPGSFFSFMTALIMAYRPMKTISKLNSYVQDMLAATERHFRAVDSQPKIVDLPDARPLSLHNSTIVFDQVSFNYLPEKKTLRQLSFEVPAGKCVALVGHSGGGKSTIMNLILRFYDPDSGRITIGGEDIKHTTLHSLRHSIAVVTQETTLFDDTVRANIAYGMNDASDDAVMDAAKAAAAHEFIQELPEGYNTLIGQRGVRLSGGQRQRIAIARAMLKNAPILLLDEATSSLDTISEQQIQNALDALMQNRTTLVIAHRLSTVRHADTILVIDNGHIIESGNHDILLEQKGAYHDLYQRQFLSREDMAA